MGKVQSCSCTQEPAPFPIEEYLDPPYINSEDIYQLKTCFDYLGPRNGIVSRREIAKVKHSAPAYMEEIVDSIIQRDADITFDDFYTMMKPKIIEMKSMPEQNVVMENTSTSVFCFFCPFRAGKASKRLLT